MGDISIKFMVREISPRQFGRFTARLYEKGRGREVAEALHVLQRRLQMNPGNLGEAIYRLAALRLQVRTVVIGPLVVNFGVHEVRPLVFIKGVRLLSKS